MIVLNNKYIVNILVRIQRGADILGNNLIISFLLS